MRSPIVQRLLDSTPFWVKLKVDAYVEAMKSGSSQEELDALMIEYTKPDEDKPKEGELPCLVAEWKLKLADIGSNPDTLKEFIEARREERLENQSIAPKSMEDIMSSSKWEGISIGSFRVDEDTYWLSPTESLIGNAPKLSYRYFDEGGNSIEPYTYVELDTYMSKGLVSKEKPVWESKVEFKLTTEQWLECISDANPYGQFREIPRMLYYNPSVRESIALRLQSSLTKPSQVKLDYHADFSEDKVKVSYLSEAWLHIAESQGISIEESKRKYGYTVDKYELPYATDVLHISKSDLSEALGKYDNWDISDLDRFPTSIQDKAIESAIEEYRSEKRKQRPFMLYMGCTCEQYFKCFDTFEQLEQELNYLTNVSNTVPLSFMYDVNEARGWYRD